MSEILEDLCNGLSIALFETELGWMALAHDGRALLQMVVGHETAASARAALKARLSGTSLGDMPGNTAPGRHNARAKPAAESRLDVTALIARFQAYAAGQPDDFVDVPLADRDPNSFRNRVLAACRGIPRGETKSYGELAAMAGSPGAARAVGSAMATNCVPLVVPCHRVVGSGGRLGGFSAHGGLALKRRLLELEEVSGKWANNEWANKSAWNKLRVSARIPPRRQKLGPSGARMN